MKQQEEKISKLFQQLKEEDDRQAPSFAHAWNMALSRQEKRKAPWRMWEVAASTALLIVLGAGGVWWWMHTKQHVQQQGAPFYDFSLQLEDKPVDGFTAPPPVSPAPLPVKKSRNVTRRQRRFVSSQPTEGLISQWRSPTESLLRIPGGQLFTRVPRLDESSVNVKATTPEPFN
jgi:cytoskeletal protein RodZ